MSFGMMLDESTDPMAETRYKKKHSDEITKLVKKTHFNRCEVECLLLLWYKFKRELPNKSAGLMQAQMFEVLHHGFDMVDSSILERVIVTMEGRYHLKRNEITFAIWVCNFSTILRGSLEEKIDFCFETYNFTNDGIIGRDTIFTLLRKSMISSGSDDDPEESAKDLIEILVKKMDLDRDGKISIGDYKTTVKKMPLLLECFGVCLPSRLAVHTFQKSVFPNIAPIL